MHRYEFSAEERSDLGWHFWRRVERQPEGCWLWKGASRAGYGSLMWRGVRAYAHRWVFVLTSGAFPSEKDVVRHICRTTLCVNPDHLLLGSIAENNADRYTDLFGSA